MMVVLIRAKISSNGRGLPFALWDTCFDNRWTIYDLVTLLLIQRVNVIGNDELKEAKDPFLVRAYE